MWKATSFWLAVIFVAATFTALAQAGQLPEAQAVASDYLAHNQRGVEYVIAGCFREAIEEFKKAVHLAPDRAIVRFNLGLAYYKSGQYKEAVESFKEVICLKKTIRKHTTDWA